MTCGRGEKKLWRTRQNVLVLHGCPPFLLFFSYFLNVGAIFAKMHNTILILLPKFSFKINLFFSDRIPLTYRALCPIQAPPTLTIHSRKALSLFCVENRHFMTLGLTQTFIDIQLSGLGGLGDT